jgi:hypothetical protein
VAGVFTVPDDLPASLIRNALADSWSFTATSLQYQPVGFGSHHWLATDARGNQLFVTVDDQAMRLHGSADTREAAFGRLRRALETALSLRSDAGLGFVVAPVAAASGLVVTPLTDRYSLAVHPYLDGAESRPDGTFASRADRLAVVSLLARLHAARASPPDPDPFAVRLARRARGRDRVHGKVLGRRSVRRASTPVAGTPRRGRFRADGRL